jgi:hypothetical protein
MFLLVVAVVGTGCDTIKNFPTNTTGGVFSLNGTWLLASTTDDKALEGTTLNVYPVVGNGTIKSVTNNTYCVKEGDQLWRSIKSNTNGGFSLAALVSACNGTTVTRDAVVNVVNNNEITLTTRTSSGREMKQQWKRVTSE